MCTSTANIGNNFILRKLLNWFNFETVSSVSLIVEVSTQLSFTTSTHHKKFSLGCEQSCMSTTTTNFFYFFIELNLSGEKLIRFVSMTKLAFISKAPGIDLSVLGDSPREIVSTADICHFD